MKPLWTVFYNIVSAENDTWIGTGYEFFDKEEDAEKCKLRHEKSGNVPTKRHFHHNDIPHLAAAHKYEIENHNNEIVGRLRLFHGLVDGGFGYTYAFKQAHNTEDHDWDAVDRDQEALTKLYLENNK